MSSSRRPHFDSLELRWPVPSAMPFSGWISVVPPIPPNKHPSVPPDLYDLNQNARPERSRDGTMRRSSSLLPPAFDPAPMPNNTPSYIHNARQNSKERGRLQRARVHLNALYEGAKRCAQSGNRIKSQSTKMSSKPRFGTISPGDTLDERSGLA